MVMLDVRFTLIGVFAIPESMGQTAQYAWFFIAYSLLNAVFYTANNIAYFALTAFNYKKQQKNVWKWGLIVLFLPFQQAFSFSLLRLNL